MRFDRMSGLNAEQLDTLVEDVDALLEEQWANTTGHPKSLSLREAVIITCGYLRQNIIQEVWAEIFDTSQPTISRIVTTITPLIDAATEPDRPTAQDAKDAIKDTTVLVDGFLAPCWSWRIAPELWSGKHKTTGFNSQLISDCRGNVLFISEPVTGRHHDMSALKESETADIIAAAFSAIADKGYQGSGYITPIKKPKSRELFDEEKEYNAEISRLRSPVERAIAHVKSWRILHTDYRRPLDTYQASFRAAIGLYFFKLAFE